MLLLKVPSYLTIIRIRFTSFKDVYLGDLLLMVIQKILIAI